MSEEEESIWEEMRGGNCDQNIFYKSIFFSIKMKNNESVDTLRSPINKKFKL